MADDCTVSVFVPEFVDPSRCAYLVYGPNGLMREVVVVRHGRYMRPSERSMLEAFLAYRESVGDDCLRLPEAPQGAPAVAMVTPLSFEHFDVARDAKRCVLVSGAGEPLVVLVVDAGGNLTDAMRVADLVDAALGDPGASEALAFLMRRRAVGDPFIEFVAVMATQALAREASGDEL